jgi:hypothetical protein
MLVTTHTCFGWAIQHFKLPEGEKFVVLARDNILRSDMSSKTFYTVGRMNAAHELEGVYTPDRPAGFFSPNELPEVLTRGKTTLTAATNSEWWCLEGKLPANKGKAPVMTPVVLEQGQSAQLPIGTKLLVCEGAGVVGNKAFSKSQAFEVATEEKTLVATSKFFGLVFDRLNPAA